MSNQYKKFVLNDKVDFLVYLRQLIIVSTKCLKKYDLYVKQLEEKIEELELNKRPNRKIDSEIYEEFNDKMQRNSNQLLNIFGDLQPDSMSYYKFRKILLKRNIEVKETLGDLSKELWKNLKDVNIARNWGMHEPESLLNAHLENIKEQWSKEELEIYRTRFSPIHVPNFLAYEGKWLISLLEEFKTNRKGYDELYNSMISDYEKLIEQSLEIKYVDFKVRPLESEIILPKTSLEMQLRKYEPKE
ncbi:hypothetical protein AWH48_12130 [Domibacillus aminovorans]|uniref:Uncharacterized protein n=1 Tax=Domibacillus aminovorans TaxID=29332 RepID=A0A177KI75_9BACI|nr:hypothetical protein [Domibacillus aminovorans]OAH53098.1 hypothetical protein AWH48_12130 [Domibacillus aminovorans]